MSEQLGHLECAPDPHVLATVIGQALGATGCAVSVAGTCHQWGDGRGQWTTCTVGYGGRPQGLLSVAPEQVGPLPKLAAVLGAPLAAIRLAAQADQLRRDGDLATRELVDDRWQATVEMERERRGLERDLHDGAQHHLVALRMEVALAEHANTPPEGRVVKLLSKLDGAGKVLVDTAAGILPTTLVSAGLAAALGAEFAGHERVVLDASGLRYRHPPLVESTVYFACLEVVNNAHKHAPGAAISVQVRDGRPGLEFVVSDNGPGFPDGPNAALPNLSARLAIVGGTLALHSAPGQGARVTGYVPR